MSTFVLGGLKWVLGILALDRISVMTVLFPLSIVARAGCLSSCSSSGESNTIVRQRK